jgi:predicted outer membrane repeat protein
LNQVTIDGNTAFDSGGGIYNTGTLRVTDSAISHNQQRFGSTFGGGGLVNLGLGTTILTHVTLDGNTADRQGGGIYTMAADLRLIDVTLSNNTSKFSDGGGLYQFTGTVQIINSTLHHNSAQTDGGGIYVLQGATLLTGTAVSNNAAYEGGGIFNYATTMLNNSTLGGNSASNQGGSIYNVGTTTVNNSTLSGNSAVHGGGIFNDVTLTLTDSTLSDNSASIDGGGIFNNSGAVRLANATLRGNAAQLGGGMINYGNSWLTNVTLDNRTSLTGTAHNLYLASGVLTLTNTLATFEASYGANCFGAGFPKSVSGGHNLANDTSCGLTATGDQQGPLVPILLGPLANHGGPTLTQLPRLGSAAIDNGDNVVCAAPLVNNLDQRGVLRPLDGNGDGIAVCDIGSVERRPTDSDLVPWLYLPLVIR